MGTDRDVLKELRTVSDINAAHLVQHYLYFPQEHDAKNIARLLKERGFEVEERLGADGINWLVLAKSKIVPTEEKIAELRSSLEGLATEYRGEYDGWEAQVQPQ